MLEFIVELFSNTLHMLSIFFYWAVAIQTQLIILQFLTYILLPLVYHSTVQSVGLNVLLVLTK